MDLWDIAKTVGSAVLSNAVPGGALMVAAVNELLPDDQKLPENATGKDVDASISKLSSEQKSSLLEKKYDVEIAHIKQSNETLRTMLESDAKSPHSTRPQIAMGCFFVLAFQTVCVCVGMIWAIVQSDEAMVAAIGELTMMLVAVTATFAYVLKAYFGILSQESRDKQNAANGYENVAGLAALASKFTGSKS